MSENEEKNETPSAGKKMPLELKYENYVEYAQFTSMEKKVVQKKESK
jgi:hypothetical protein